MRRIDVPIPAVPPPVAPPRGFELVTAVAKCKPGERAVGGGAGVTNGRDETAHVLDSEPAVGTAPARDGEVPTGWLASGLNPGAEEAEMRVHAICVEP